MMEKRSRVRKMQKRLAELSAMRSENNAHTKTSKEASSVSVTEPPGGGVPSSAGSDDGTYDMFEMCLQCIDRAIVGFLRPSLPSRLSGI